MELSLMDACSQGKRLIGEIFAEPLRDLLAKSFIVATKGEVSLFVSEEIIPKEEQMRIRSLDALVNLKILTIQTYAYMNQLVQNKYEDCYSRSGSQCFFKERLASPKPTVIRDQFSYVYDSLLDVKNVTLTFKNVVKSLEALSEMRLRNTSNSSD